MLDISGLHQFRGYRHVLKGVDLQIGHGEIVGLIGRNGSGKSTLVQTICGAESPRSGSMTLDGRPYHPTNAAAARAAGISVIDQDFAVPEGLTVLENLVRHTVLAARPRSEQLGRAEQLLTRSGFDLDLARPLHELDPAGQALAEVLRVQAEGARLVIFDEVSALLNDLEIAQLHEAARHLRDQGCSIVHIAHRLEDITALADRIVVLRGGVVVEPDLSGRRAMDDLVRAMLGRELEVTPREARERDRVVYAVRGLSVTGRVDPLDLDLHAGEVLGVVGLRHSGAHELVEALAGRGQVHALSTELMAGADGQEGWVAYVSGTSPETLKMRQSDVLTTGQEHLDDEERLRLAFVRAIEHDMETSNLHNPLGSLSGGDRQKASIVAVADTAASVVVLGHPTRGVDVGSKEMAYRVIEQLVAKGKALVMLSSDLTELLRICDRVAVMHDGRLVAVLDTSAAHEDLVMSYAMTGGAPEVAPEVRGRRRGSDSPASVG
ncbi:MAG: ATP-binding cassette domain-containing protein [Actinomycetota bacterium]|nr:ATP-binding cassette domain-containing protein [Actinomycetota bacterium]